MTYLLGIGDASEYDTNARTDWSLAARRGCQWGLVRACTTGAWSNGKPSLKKDPMFEANAANMKAAGMKRATYAWFDARVKYVSAQDQAMFFLETIKSVGPGEFGAVLDVEDSGAVKAYTGIGTHVLTWLSIVEKALQVRPCIYVNQDFTLNYLFGATIKESWLPDYEVIIASWGGPAPVVPQPWSPLTWRAWQYRANAPGAYYGFHNAVVGKAAPNICLALWNSDSPQQSKY